MDAPLKVLFPKWWIKQITEAKIPDRLLVRYEDGKKIEDHGTLYAYIKGKAERIKLGKWKKIFDKLMKQESMGTDSRGRRIEGLYTMLDNYRDAESRRLLNFLASADPDTLK